MRYLLSLLLLLNLSSSVFAFTVERIEYSEAYELTSEREIFVKAFKQKYSSIPELSSLDLDKFLNEAFNDELVDYKNRKENTLFFRAVDEDQIVGFVSFDVNQVGKSAYIRQLAVDPKFQGRGIGKSLTFKLADLKKVSRLELVTRKVNQDAIEFYKALEFKINETLVHEGLDPKKYIGLEWNQ